MISRMFRNTMAILLVTALVVFIMILAGKNLSDFRNSLKTDVNIETYTQNFYKCYAMSDGSGIAAQECKSLAKRIAEEKG